MTSIFKVLNSTIKFSRTERFEVLPHVQTFMLNDFEFICSVSFVSQYICYGLIAL